MEVELTQPLKIRSSQPEVSPSRPSLVRRIIMNPLKLALIGCGAQSRIHHLPSIHRSDLVDLRVLVDTNLERARDLSQQYAVPSVAQDYKTIFGQVDAAIVSLPNFLHAPVAIDLLRNGIHVLVEKPMALRTGDCDEMIEIADRSSLALAVGLDMRFINSIQFVKDFLENRMLGRIKSFDLRQGVIMTWPLASDYLLRKEAAGGGVLTDFGTHLLDMLLWWLGDFASFEYYDDAMGGVEADCELHLTLPGGAHGLVELSRTRNLRNTCVLNGEYGSLEVGVWDFDSPVHLKLKDRDVSLSGQGLRNNQASNSEADVFDRQLHDFVQSILTRRTPLVSGPEGRRSVQLIEDCYASRHLLTHPWSIADIFNRLDDRDSI
jgi:predicted dehydrogenase